MRGSGLTGQTEMSGVEITLLLSEVAGSKGEGRILEIGTAAGGTLVQVLKTLPVSEHARVSVVDTFDYYPDHMGIFRRNLSDNGLDPDTIDARASRSNIALKGSIGRGETFSFIIVDGSHKLKHVMEDLRWLGLLEVGGVAALHDYSEREPGVKLAVDRFLSRNLNYKIKAQAGTLLVLEKTAVSKGAEVTWLDLIFANVYNVVLQNKKSINRVAAIFR